MQKKRQCHKVCISRSKYETKGYPSAFNCCNVSSPFRCLSSYLKPVLWLWIIVTLLHATQIRHSVSQAGGMVFMMYSVWSVPGKHTKHTNDSAGVFHNSFIAWLFRSRFHLKPCRLIYPVAPCGFGVEVSLIWLCATLLLNIHSVISICLPLFPCKMQWVWHWTVAKAFTLNRILLNTFRKQWGEGSGFLLSFSLLLNKKN